MAPPLQPADQRADGTREGKNHAEQHAQSQHHRRGGVVEHPAPHGRHGYGPGVPAREVARVVGVRTMVAEKEHLPGRYLHVVRSVPAVDLSVLQIGLLERGVVDRQACAVEDHMVAPQTDDALQHRLALEPLRHAEEHDIASPYLRAGRPRDENAVARSVGGLHRPAGEGDHRVAATDGPERARCQHDPQDGKHSPRDQQPTPSVPHPPISPQTLTPARWLQRHRRGSLPTGPQRGRADRRAGECR